MADALAGSQAPDEPFALEQARELVGTVLQARQQVVVEPAMVDAFELAVGDAGRTSADGVRYAPPTIIYQLFRQEFDVTRDERPAPLISMPLGTRMNGGIEFEFTRPVRVGETLSAETLLESIDLRQASKGHLLVLVARTSIRDSSGIEVDAYRHTTLYRRS